MRNVLKAAIVLLVSTLVTSLGVAAENEQIYGTWRLVGYTQTDLASGQTTNVFGKAPHGLITYGRDGRLSVLIVNEERPKPASLGAMTDKDRAELFRGMIAYAGTFTFTAKTVTHNLEISWNHLWDGTSLTRNIRFDGRQLTLTTDPQPRAQDGKPVVAVLTWERIE